jgi:adenylosuccinate synthase
MGSYAVIGMGFGDEGKGLTTNALCAQFPDALVVRYSGGQQAGHTVEFNGASHVFSNFGAGTLQGKPTYWSRYCTFDPVAVLRELDVLLAKGITPKLYIDRASPVTTPFEKYKNQNGQEMEHGTCGCGVGATYEREAKFQSLLVGDIEYNWIFRQKLKLIEKSHTVKLDLSKFYESCMAVLNSHYIEFVDGLPEARDYVFEGSQGLLLDQHYGFFPHVTRSNTGTKNILEMGETPTVLLVTRAFQTRHGNGPMSNENLSHNILDNAKEANIMNDYQGKFRKSLLDLSLLRYGMERDVYIRNTEKKELVLTCLDLVKDEYRYTIDGRLIGHADEDSFVQGIEDYLGIYKTHRVRSPSALFKI